MAFVARAPLKRTIVSRVTATPVSSSTGEVVAMLVDDRCLKRKNCATEERRSVTPKRSFFSVGVVLTCCQLEELPRVEVCSSTKPVAAAGQSIWAVWLSNRRMLRSGCERAGSEVTTRKRMTKERNDFCMSFRGKHGSKHL